MSQGRPKSWFLTYLESPVFIGVLIVFALVTLFLLVYGAVLLSQVAANTQFVIDSAGSSLKSYQQHDISALRASSFNVNASMNSNMLPLTLMNATGLVIPDNPSYTESLFFGQFAVPPVPTVFDPLGSIPNVTVGVWGQIQGHPGHLLDLPEIPLWQMTTAVGSIQVKKCVLAGGLPDYARSLCYNRLNLQSVCVQVAANFSSSVRQWTTATGQGLGCTYPFDTLGVYANVNYDTIPPPLMNITVMSADDPYIQVQILTQGDINFLDLNAGETKIGTGLIISGVCILVILASTLVGRFIYKRCVEDKTMASLELSMGLLDEISHVDIKSPGMRPVQMDSRLWLQFAASLLLIGGGLGIGLSLLAHWSEEKVFSFTPFVGMVLIHLCFPVGIIFHIMTLSTVARRHSWSRALRAVVFSSSFVVCLAVVAIAIPVLIRPSVALGPAPEDADALTAFYGVAIALLFLSLAVISLLQAIRVATTPATSTTAHGSDPKPDLSGMSVRDGPLRSVQPNRRVEVLVGGGIGALIFFCLLVLTGALPPLWNVSQITYNTFQSPYAVTQVTVTHGFVIKIYPDVLMFYGYIWVILIISVLTELIAPLKRLLHHRLRIGPPHHLNVLYRFGASVGELLLLALTMGLYAWWMWYWYAANPRIAKIDLLYVRVARALGEQTSLFLSLLVFPVTRNSIWTRVFGMPYERFMRYHRFMGVVVFLSMTSHMVTWDALWYKNGVLLNSIFNAPHEVNDDFSIPMVELAWIAVLVMQLTALPVIRRKYFEYFHRVHHLFLFVLACALLHAWSLWYFLCGSLTLWLGDRIMRFMRGTRSVELVSIEHGCHGITRIVVRCDAIQPYAGDLIEKPIDFVSQWHPFSFSSSPSSDLLSFHIKDMTLGTHVSLTKQRDEFTHRLSRYAYAATAAMQQGTRVDVCVDGPYGCAPDYADSEVVLLFAGGIGITPLHSIYLDLLQRFVAGGGSQDGLGVAGILGTAIKRVHLVWTVQHAALLNMFAETLHQAARMDPEERVFSFSLHSTQVNDVDLDPSPLDQPFSGTTPEALECVRTRTQKGRPRLADTITRFTSGVSVRKRPIAMVCGAPSMVSELSELSFRYGVDFHTETFEL